MSERPPPSTLKGRLADVFFPAIVASELDGLAKRLGNRATLDDPRLGRAASLSSIEPMLTKLASHFGGEGTTYRRVASTTGIDRDVAEGVVVSPRGELPVAVVAERRRLREVELRLYYFTDGPLTDAPRSPPVAAAAPTLPQLIEHVLDAIRRGAIERVLAAFEEGSRVVDTRGAAHAKRDGRMSAFFSELGTLTTTPVAAPDDARTCCVEGVVEAIGKGARSALWCFERGDSGLLRELRLYLDREA